MFFKGSLNQGISTALQESRLVACFVADDGDESATWETWIKDHETISKRLESKAILLRLVAGGEEAGYLTAFCPIQKTPALIVIKNGVPIANLQSGLSQADFRFGLLQALKDDPTPPESQARTVVSQQATDTAAIDTQLSTASVSARTTSERPTASANSSTAPTTAAQSLAETSGKGKEGQEKADRAAEIKKSQSDALAERRRILAQIDNDKKERQARDQERKQAAKAEQTQTVQEEQRAAKQSAATARKNHKECSLKIRTFDGSTISSTFPSDQTLHKHVRSWIDSALESPDTPYEFKQVLAPLPNRRIGASEEEESLISIGLAPTATLVMVPIKGYSTAYTDSSPGVIGSVLSHGYSIVSWGLGTAGAVMGSVLGPARETTKSEEATDEEPSSSSSNIRIRTLADQRRGRDDQELYNGNQLNFERRKDDDDKDE